MSFSCNLHKKIPYYYCIVLCYQRWCHWQHNSFCIYVHDLKSPSYEWWFGYMSREKITLLLITSWLSYTIVAVNSRGNGSLLQKLRKQHHLKQILVSKSSVDLVVWCLWPVFPQHVSDGGEGFYAGVTFVPTDTQDQHCSGPCYPCRRGCPCCMFSTITWEKIFLLT